MKISRSTLDIMLAAAVNLWELVEATASGFSTHVFGADLGDRPGTVRIGKPSHGSSVDIVLHFN